MKTIIDPLRYAPNVPFRPLTEDEQKVCWDFARTLKDIDLENRFWQKTIPYANKRAEQIQNEGYVLTDSSEWGNSMDGFGAHIHIYPPKTNLADLKERVDRTKVVGSLELWQSGGFIHEPLSVWYSPEQGIVKQIEDAFRFREYLVQEKIPFFETTNIVRLKEQALRLETEAYATRHLIRRLSGLRKDKYNPAD